MHSGFEDRLHREIQKLAGVTAYVIDAADRDKSAWIGGSILASMANFKKMWITKQDYYEYGPSIVHKKCF